MNALELADELEAMVKIFDGSPSNYAISLTINILRQKQAEIEALKAHLVKELTLTDEDILEEWTCKYSDCYQDTLIEVARAILRKASEK